MLDCHNLKIAVNCSTLVKFDRSNKFDRIIKSSVASKLMGKEKIKSFRGKIYFTGDGTWIIWVDVHETFKNINLMIEFITFAYIKE